MFEAEVKIIDKFLEWGNIDKRVRNSWDSIKKHLEESCQLPTTGDKSEPQEDIPPDIRYCNNCDKECDFRDKDSVCVCGEPA